MKFFVKIAAFSMLVFVVGCQELPNYFVGDNTIARVGRKTLYMRDVASAVPDGMAGEDSVAFVDIYVERWIKKQLKLQEAELLFSSAEQDIDAMVEEYRQSLLIRKLDKYYVDRSVDTTFTDNDIISYYNEHKADFKLDRTIVRGKVLRFNDGYRQSKRLMEMMISASPSMQRDFRDICEKNNFTYTDFSGSWVDYADYLTNLPTLQSQNYDSALGVRGVQQMRDSYSQYYFQITDVLRAGDTIPLERVREAIRRILFNQRQGDLIKEQEDAIYLRATKNGEIKIYEND